MAASQDLIKDIRDVSRAVVREWGFMGGRFAGTDLPPSAVHALIEVESADRTARDLARLLRLEKSSISRLLKSLVASGYLREEAGDRDGRVKTLSLTALGHQQIAVIHAFANDQVARALEQLKPGQDHKVLEGLQLYRRALAVRDENALSPPDIEIVRGYQTGLIGRVTEMHAHYYTREAGFGRYFEAVIASGLADLCDRLDNPKNEIWAAMRGREIVGSVSIDGEDLGDGIAHLRCFIVSDNVRGGGSGRKLLSAALAFADEREFAQTHLWTFQGLSAARYLYDSFGFECVEEKIGAQWGAEVMEQRLARARP